MTADARDLGLVGLAVDRLRYDAVEAFEALAAAREDTDEREIFMAWAGQIAGLRTLAPTLTITDDAEVLAPAITVHLISDDFSPDLAPEIGAVQRARAVLAVVHTVYAADTRRGAGEEAVDPLAVLLGATRAALQGWRPYIIGGSDALALIRGRLLAPPTDGLALWQDEYIFSWTAGVDPGLQFAFAAVEAARKEGEKT